MLPTTPKTSTPDRVNPALIGTLALLSAVAPLATDLYLSTLPAMAGELSTSATGVQLSLTAFLVGAGLGQLVFGPLSDRLGRRGPLLVGMGVYLASSLAAALAPSLPLLVLARLFQGVSGAAGMVLGRAIIADRVSGVAAAKALSVMMLVGGVAPILAPFVGSLLAGPIGWRGVLGVVAALGAVALVLVLVFVPETRGPEARAAGRGAQEEGRLLSRRYLGNMVAFAFAFSTMMAYISASPFVYQKMMGMSEVQYGLMFGLNSVCMLVAGGLGAKALGRFSAVQVARFGLLANFAAVVALALVVLAKLPAIWLSLPLLFAVAALGLVLGNVTALALEAVPGRSGSASAWLGCLQFVLAGVVSALVGLGGEYTATPMVMVMLVGSVVALGSFLLAGGARGARVEAVESLT